MGVLYGRLTLKFVIIFCKIPEVMDMHSIVYIPVPLWLKV